MKRLILSLLMTFMMPTMAASSEAAQAPRIDSEAWLNSPPLTMQALRGKVVLVEFWTFGCINCRHVEPYIKNWYEAYQDKGLVVIGVHSPELSFERNLGNLSAYIAGHRITYPVAVDNDFRIWNAWHNHYWPALYLVDKKGTIRYRHIGEGGYDTTEAFIRRLIGE